MRPKLKGEIEHDEGLKLFEAKLAKRKMEEISKLAENYEEWKEEVRKEKIETFETIANEAIETAKSGISEGLDLLSKNPAGRVKVHEFYEKKPRGQR